MTPNPSTSPTSTLSLMLRPITSSSAAQSIRALTHDMELIRAEMITRIGEKARERDALIDTLIARGWGMGRIAEETGLSKGRVVQIRDRDKGKDKGKGDQNGKGEK